MATLKWTIDIKLNDAPILNIPSPMEVERDSSDIILPIGKAIRNVPLVQRGKLVLLQIQANNAKKDTAQLIVGKNKIMLNKPVLFTSGLPGLFSSKQSTVEILRTKPAVLKFVNKSQTDSIRVTITSAWQVKAGKKKV